MEVVSLQIEGCNFLVRDLDADGVGGLVDFRMHFESCGDGGGSDELNDDFLADERFALPVLADEGRRGDGRRFTLAGAGRQVGNFDRKTL